MMHLQNILQKASFRPAATLSLKFNSGHLIQVRNHVKMYPWRFNRTNRECYLDNRETPYTDRRNINEFTHKKQRKPWQIVIPKDKDERFNSYHWNENYKSNPEEAKETAQSRLSRFTDSLRDRGTARESVAYDPPEDVRQRIISIYKGFQLQGQTKSGEIRPTENEEEILAINLNVNRGLKVNLLSQCIEKFYHDLPNSYLNGIETVADLVEYFSTPVRGVNPYTAMLQRENSLPPNLSLIAEPIRYNRESDTYFQGHNAFPGLVCKVPGLRGSKKYPTLNQDEFQWPDI